jgi:hypothetical protein
VNVAASFVYQAYETHVFDQAVSLRQVMRPVTEAVPAAARSLVVKNRYSAVERPTGNVGVAAHQDALFRNLKDVRRYDRITRPRSTAKLLSPRLIQSNQADGPFRPGLIAG